MNELVPPNVEPLTEAQEETLTLRLEAARSAQERTRFSFLTVTVISFAMLTAGWNAHLSLYRDVAEEFSALVHVDGTKDTNTGVQELQRDFLREFVSDRMINISLLGIRVGADDAPILGTGALLVALIWFYLSVRRENFIIGWLLYDSSSAATEKKIRLRVLHGIISHSIFTRAWRIDEPFDKMTSFPRNQPARLLRLVSARMYLLPLYAVYGVLLLEVVALCRTSPFRPTGHSLFATMLSEYPWDFSRRMFRFVISIILVFFCVRRLCKRIQRFEESTEQILREFYLSIYPATPEGVAAQSTPDKPVA